MSSVYIHTPVLRPIDWSRKTGVPGENGILTDCMYNGEHCMHYAVPCMWKVLEYIQYIVLFSTWHNAAAKCHDNKGFIRGSLLKLHITNTGPHTMSVPPMYARLDMIRLKACRRTTIAISHTVCTMISWRACFGYTAAAICKQRIHGRAGPSSYSTSGLVACFQSRWLMYVLYICTASTTSEPGLFFSIQARQQHDPSLLHGCEPCLLLLLLLLH